MDHVAIMKKSWGLIPKILSGEKKLESRWYLNRSKPWDGVTAGDTIFFKNSGGPVVAKAVVLKVRQYSGLKPVIVKKLLKKYAKDDGLGIEKTNLERFYQLFKDKKYALFIYLDRPELSKSHF